MRTETLVKRIAMLCAVATMTACGGNDAAPAVAGTWNLNMAWTTGGKCFGPMTIAQDGAAISGAWECTSTEVVETPKGPVNVMWTDHGAVSGVVAGGAVTLTLHGVVDWTGPVIVSADAISGTVAGPMDPRFTATIDARRVP